MKDRTRLSPSSPDLHLKERARLPSGILSTTSLLESLDAAHSPLPSHLFAKPGLPVSRKSRFQPSDAEVSPNLAAKPGKNWRRSIAVAAASAPIPDLTRLSLAPSLTTSAAKPRSSFYVVPAISASRYSCLESVQRKLVLDETVSTPEVELGLDEQLLAVCSSNTVVQFEDVYTQELMEGAVKLGEGAFGEVFRVGAKEGASVLKIVPFGGDIDINDEKQTRTEDIISEVAISMALSKLREGTDSTTDGFVEVRGAYVFQGSYPTCLLRLWDQYAEEGETENERPDSLGSDQKFLSLEFNNAGRDLEKFAFKHAEQAFQAWKQVAYSLAVAEERLKFEHRDLHWGNVLVKETKSKDPVRCKLGGDTFLVETGGVLTTIIDFSLSRAELNEKLIFNNLAEDPSIFQGRGKAQAGGDYQFDIYRKMKTNNKNQWEEFQPQTNLYWLHYLLEKMTVSGQVNYSGKKTSKPHKSGNTVASDYL